MLDIIDMDTMPNGFAKAAIKRFDLFGKGLQNSRFHMDITKSLSHASYACSAGPFGKLGFEIIYKYLSDTGIFSTSAEKIKTCYWKIPFEDVLSRIVIPSVVCHTLENYDGEKVRDSDQAVRLFCKSWEVGSATFPEHDLSVLCEMPEHRTDI